jgi:hypothetical protein
MLVLWLIKIEIMLRAFRHYLSLKFSELIFRCPPFDKLKVQLNLIREDSWNLLVEIDQLKKSNSAVINQLTNLNILLPDYKQIESILNLIGNLDRRIDKLAAEISKHKPEGYENLEKACLLNLFMKDLSIEVNTDLIVLMYGNYCASFSTNYYFWFIVISSGLLQDLEKIISKYELEQKHN